MSTPDRNWATKFRDAARGIIKACGGEKSFAIHLLAAVLVIVAGFVLQVTATEWCVLLLCIAGVLAAETFNSSIEALAKAVTSEHDENVGRGLDIAAGAVLLTAIGAAAVGLIIFVPRLLEFLRSE